MAHPDLIARHQELQRDAVRVGLGFLLCDVETALAFMDRAEQNFADQETRERNLKNARQGYKTVSRLLAEMNRTYVEKDVLDELQDRLAVLRSRLARSA